MVEICYEVHRELGKKSLVNYGGKSRGDGGEGRWLTVVVVEKEEDQIKEDRKMFMNGKARDFFWGKIMVGYFILALVIA